MTTPLRIANCSGFYGDRLSAALEMVEGGPIDVLTGDWLAELTMLILARTQAKNPGAGYARSFVAQMEQVMGIGQIGRLAQLEDRMHEHEKAVQRMKGVMGAFGGLLTIIHLAIDIFIGRR